MGKLKTLTVIAWRAFSAQQAAFTRRLPWTIAHWTSLVKSGGFKGLIDSVLAQVYTNWELCIADDASTLPHVKKTLQEYQGRDDTRA
jgi:hypothetical protein